MNKPEIMTLEEVAEYLRVSERTVYDWAQKGDIPCGKFGTSWRFRRKDIEAWVNHKLAPKDEINENQIKLKSVLSEDRVLLLDAETKMTAIDAMIELLKSDPRVKNKESIRDGIYRREELMSTGIGLGVAIPHVRTQDVKDLVVVAAVCKSGLSDYETMDQEPVRLLFMIIAREDQHALHLKTLSAISSILKDSKLKNLLLSVNSSSEFMDIIKKYEK